MPTNLEIGVGVVVVLVVGFILSELARKRSYTLPERFLFENTYLLAIHDARLLDYIQERFAEVKNRTMHIPLLLLPNLVITNTVENVTYILKTNFESYGKGPIFKYRFQALLGDGIFNTDGEKWYKHRKTSAHLFNTNKFRTTVLDTFNRHCDELVGIIDSHASKGTKGEAFNIAALMFKFTLDSIGFIAFGKEIGSLHKDRVPFADCFDFCQETINQSFFDPLWMLRRAFTPGGWHYYRCLKIVDDYAFGVVREKREAVAKTSKSDKKQVGGGDLLSLYLDRDAADTSDDKPELTDRNLRDVVLNFVIAGRDTTAQALSWSFYRLCIHPEVQVLLRKDIAQVMKSCNPDGTVSNLTYECLQSMKLLEAFCMEVLRFHPSVPKEAKYASKDDTLPDGTKVKKGDLIVFCPWVMGRSDSIWPNASEFRLDRHYTVTEGGGSEPSSAHINLIKHSAFKFIAFQAGPRTCLGLNLAMLEMKCCLVRLLSKFEFTLAQPKESVTYVNTITLPIKGGLSVVATPVK